MHTVVETPTFVRAAKAAGMTDKEREKVVSALAENPEVGAVIQRSGGCRKVRFGGKGKGKSGGYRVVTFYADRYIPLFVLTVLAKNQSENFSDAETNELAKLVAGIKASYRKRVKRLEAR